MQFFWGLGGRQYWYWQQALNIVHILCTRWQKTSLPVSSSAFCKQCSSIIVWGGTICLSVAHSGICLASVPRLVDCHLFHCHHHHNKVEQPRILTCSVSSHWKIDSGQCLCNQQPASQQPWLKFGEKESNWKQKTRPRLITGAVSLTENFQWTTFYIINQSLRRNTKTQCKWY